MKQEVIQKAEGRQIPQGPNLTGIPAQMKLDFEHRSGLSFDDVRVHYNSDKPARIGALAYTQGTQVHIGPGQEKHLRHELGHVVQQKTETIHPTIWSHGVPINDDTMLEMDADKTALSKSKTRSHPMGLSVIQRKLAVGVSLQIGGDPYADYESSNVVVDTVKLSGRSATGLPGGSQGDHTIADALIKKYQKVMVRNKPLPAVHEFYWSEFEQIKCANESVLSSRQVLNDSQIRRVQNSNGLVDRGQKELIEQRALGSETLYGHRKALKEIILLYNDAYAHSFYSTQGTGSGGKSEKEGMKVVRTAVKNGESDIPSQIMTLLDFNSIKALATGVDLGASVHVIRKFSSIINNMYGYGKTGDGSAQPYQGEGVLPIDLSKFKTEAMKDVAELSLYSALSSHADDLHAALNSISSTAYAGEENSKIDGNEVYNRLHKIYIMWSQTNAIQEFNEGTQDLQGQFQGIMAALQQAGETENNIILGNTITELSNVLSAFSVRCKAFQLEIANNLTREFQGSENKVGAEVVISYIEQMLSGQNQIRLSISDMETALGGDRAVILRCLNAERVKKRFRIEKHKNGTAIEAIDVSLLLPATS